jgi:AcrR family transcriptional regulator
MTAVTLSDARAELVRTRVLDGVAEVLGHGEALTFANVAAAAGVPERTFYRHFPTREALMAAVFDWANARIGFHGALPATAEDVTALVRKVFPGFDGIAPVVRELLIAPEGKVARLASKEARQKASLAVVRHELGPDAALDRASVRRVAAVVQLLTSAAAWQALREYWDMDGEEAAEASALAVELLLEGARARARARKQRRAKQSQASKRGGS